MSGWESHSLPSALVENELPGRACVKAEYSEG
jgi:hypothetical protein